MDSSDECPEIVKSSTTRATTLRWATFDDLLDDALEEGKLSPTSYVCDRRRMSVASPYFSSSLSSDSSFGSTGDGNHQHFQSTFISDFSQSFGGVQARTSAIHATPNRHSTREKASEMVSTVLRSCSALPSLFIATVSETSSTSSTQTLNQRKISGEDEDDDEDEHERGDKYKVFRRLSTARYKGWSSKVLGTGGNGWTDELLDADGGVDVAAGVVGVAAGNSSSTEEESNSEKDEEIFFSRPTSLEVSVVEEPWYQGHGGFSSTTWDKSPSRSFLRNYP